mmetsp:Transcript_9471/g.21376  ORF Transcript_9471/g.21376 Transcript_9471/m.21376 type:complete len:223 (-) Transcript_9471:323-991(-)
MFVVLHPLCFLDRIWSPECHRIIVFPSALFPCISIRFTISSTTISLLQLDGSMAGDVGFDPLGLSNIDDVGIDLYWLREAEVKHGRVAMLAVAGFLQVELFGPAPGCEAATAKCQTDAFWQIWNSHPQYIIGSIFFITIIEMVSGIATTSGRESGDRAPGDFGLDPLGYLKGDPVKADRLKAQEIANGRLAMWAAAGLLVQGCSNHMGGVEAMSASLDSNMF